jgi:DNA-binding NtrC family response regulator
MSGTGNTTVPTGPDSSPSPASSARTVPALVICWSHHQPDRAGEVALFDPHDPGPFIVGREDPTDPPRVHFFQQRPGESVDGGALTGQNISHQQLRVRAEPEGLRIEVIGRAAVFVDGSAVERGATVLVRAGAVLEMRGHSVLLVAMRPVAIPPPNAKLLPLHSFGEADRHGLVGESPAAWALRESIAFAASAGRHVLLHGPTGTGKELAAPAIHALSPRSGGPFVTANAADFSSELVASLLFGNPRGYPNPSMPERPGFFGQARHGTLLLDEIGEIPPAMQAPLLRALQSGYNRVGEAASRPTECVVLLSTNRGLSSIKHDLLQRLGVVVEPPALSARREDIPLLVRARLLAWARAHEELAKPFVRRDAHGWLYVAVDASLIVGLLRSPLEGNVRELDNILTRSIEAARGQPPLRWPRGLTLAPPPPPVAPPEPEEIDVDDLVGGIRRAPAPSAAAVRKALDAHDWHYVQAAATLGITVDKLYRLRQKYGLLERG